MKMMTQKISWGAGLKRGFGWGLLGGSIPLSLAISQSGGAPLLPVPTAIFIVGWMITGAVLVK